MSPSASAAPAEEKEDCAIRPLGVLVVDEELPYPLTSGKRIRTFNLLRHLAANHRIVFLCHNSHDQSEQKEAEQVFANAGIQVEFLNRKLPVQTLLTSKTKLFTQLARNLFSTYPFLVQKHISRELCERVREIASQANIDLVHFEWTPYAAAIDRMSSAQSLERPWVVDAHNVESLIWDRYSLNESNPIKRAYIGYQARKMHRFEARVFQSASEMVFVSSPDREIARHEFGCRQGQVVDNGVDVSWFEPESPDQRDPQRLLFLGSLDWRPNTDGVVQLLDQVFPALRSRYPHVRLDIVGRKPADWLKQKIKTSEGATLHADVPDVRPFLRKCGMLLVPLRIGGGSRLKILEALASGTPVVSTAIGAEGLDIEPGQHYCQMGEVETMAEVIGGAIDSWPEQQRMALAGRQVIREQYDWPALTARLESVWQQAVNSFGSSA